MDQKEWNGPGGITFTTDDNKFMVWGWVSVILSVAVGVAVWQLSAAIATGILILSGCGGFSMLVYAGAKAWAGVLIARAHAKRIESEGKAALIGARNAYLLEGRE